MNEIDVTVVIPFYNRSSTICRAVESVLRQHNVDSVRIAILIIDDGSTPAENEVLHSKMMKYDRVEIVSCESNMGACHARNVGIQRAETDFIAFLDSDDEWTDSFLSESIAHISKTGWTSSGFSVLGRFGLHNSTKSMNGLGVPEHLIVRGGHLSTCCTVMKTDMARETQWNEKLKRFQDWDFAIRMSANGHTPYFISKPLVIVHKGEANRISNQAGTLLAKHWATEIAPYISKEMVAYFLARKIPHCLVQEGKCVKAIAASLSVSTYSALGLRKYVSNCVSVIISICFNIALVVRDIENRQTNGKAQNQRV